MNSSTAICRAFFLPISRQRFLSVPLKRCLGLWLMQAMMLGAAWAQPSANEFSAEERLEAIRQGLVQKALEGATRVESMAWIDGQGVLREGSSFRSGMDVRGVQVLRYLRDNTGSPQAQLRVPSGQDVLRPSAPPASAALVSAAPACLKSPTLRHLMGLSLTVEGGWSVDAAPLAQALGQLTASVLQQSGGSAAGWGILPKPAPLQSAYERILLATSADQLPWQAYLTVKPIPPIQATSPTEAMLPAWMTSTVPSLSVQLSFSVVARGQSRPAYENSVELEIPRPAQAWGRPQLEASVRSQVSRLIQPWTQALSERLACEAVLPEVISVRGVELNINAGTLAGVRTGDEWLLADPQRFPQQILAPVVAAGAVLARVGQVYPHHAQLQIVAGPTDGVRTDWRAWRADSPDLSASVRR